MHEKLFQKSGLSLERLRSLAEVDAVGSVAKAADHDPTRQSLYSRQLRELEQYFGVPLTKKKGRMLQLTDAGKRLSVMTRDFFSGIEVIGEEFDARKITYVISAGDSVLQLLVTPTLAELRREQPEVSFVCRNLRSADTVRSVIEGTSDLGIVKKSALRDDLQSEVLGKVAYSLFIPDQLKSKVDCTTSASALRSGPLAVLNEDGDYMFALRRIAGRGKQRLDESLACHSLMNICEAIKTGGFMGVLPSTAGEALRGSKVAEIKLRNRNGLSRTLCLCWRKRLVDVRPDAERFIRSLTRVIQDRL